MAMREITNKDIRAVLKEHEQHRESLIPILQGIQKKLGYISEEAVEVISSHLNISENDIYGVATFYAQFRFEPPGDHVVLVCLGTACHVRGAPRLLEELERRLGIRSGKTTKDRKFTLQTVNCIGACALGPIVAVDGEFHGQMSPEKVHKLLEMYLNKKAT